MARVGPVYWTVPAIDRSHWRFERDFWSVTTKTITCRILRCVSMREVIENEIREIGRLLKSRRRSQRIEYVKIAKTTLPLIPKNTETRLCYPWATRTNENSSLNTLTCVSRKLPYFNVNCRSLYERAYKSKGIGSEECAYTIFGISCKHGGGSRMGNWARKIRDVHRVVVKVLNDFDVRRVCSCDVTVLISPLGVY